MRRLFISIATLVLAWAPVRSSLAEGRTLSLREALSIARSRSPVLKKAAAQTDAAKARANSSRGRLLPQLVGSGSWQHTTDNFVRRPGFSGGSATQQLQSVDDPSMRFTVVPSARSADPKWNFVDSYNFGLTATQLIYDFSAIDAFKADRETARSQLEQERALLLTTEFAVRNAFFLARAQRELVMVADRTLANQEKHLAQIQAFVEVGTRPEIDLAQARTDMANARVSLLRAQNAYANAKESLKQVLGASPNDDYEVNDDSLPVLEEEQLSSGELFSRATKSRPELTALERQLSAQSLRTRATKGRFGPALSLNGSINKAGIKLGELTTNAYVGASASWNLLQSGGAFAAVREQEANQRALEADIDSMLLRIRVELEQARLGIEAAKGALDASQEALNNARARLSLAEGRYEAGVGNAIELGDAQLALTSADAQRVQSEYNLAIARAQLLAALGKNL